MKLTSPTATPNSTSAVAKRAPSQSSQVPTQQTIIALNVIMEQTDQQKSNKLPETSEQFLQRLTESPLETQVEELAALFFSIREIALFVGMDEENLRTEINCDTEEAVSKAYYRGKLRTKILLRFDSRNYALHGSTQALQEMREHMSDQEIDENA